MVDDDVVQQLPEDRFLCKNPRIHDEMAPSSAERCEVEVELMFSDCL